MAAEWVQQKKQELQHAIPVAVRRNATLAAAAAGGLPTRISAGTAA
jgi:hypothetical protein